jgi:ribosome modulation factor
MEVGQGPNVGCSAKGKKMCYFQENNGTRTKWLNAKCQVRQNWLFRLDRFNFFSVFSNPQSFAEQQPT